MTWARHGDLRDTSRRYADTAKQLEALGGTRVVPEGESAVDAMRLEIARLEKLRAPPQRDAVYYEAQAEFSNVLARLTALYSSICQDQKRLERLKDSPEFQILGSIGDDLFKPPPPPQAVLDLLFNGGRVIARPHAHVLATEVPSFNTMSEVKAATRSLLKEVHAIEAVAARISAALEHDRDEPAAQAKRLIFALAARIGVLEARLDAIETSHQPKRKRA